MPEGKCCPSRDLCPLQHCQGISCPPKVVYPKLQLMIRLRDVLILPSNSSSSTDHQRCPTGDLAPIPRNSCCPSKAECDNTNCSQVFFTVPRNRVECGRFGNIKSFFLLQVRCIVERCIDGSIAPVPKGQCCPSKRACPTQVISCVVKIQSKILDAQIFQYFLYTEQF